MRASGTLARRLLLPGHRDHGGPAVVEQNVELALNPAHRGYILESGRTILEGSSAALLQSAEVKRTFLGG